MASKKDELSLILDSTIDLPFKFSDISITGWKYNEKIPFTLDQLFIKFLVAYGDLWLIDVDKWYTRQIFGTPFIRELIKESIINLKSNKFSTFSSVFQSFHHNSNKRIIFLNQSKKIKIG